MIKRGRAKCFALSAVLSRQQWVFVRTSGYLCGLYNGFVADTVIPAKAGIQPLDPRLRGS
jgi:hypothetical protein